MTVSLTNVFFSVFQFADEEAATIRYTDMLRYFEQVNKWKNGVYITGDRPASSI